MPLAIITQPWRSTPNYQAMLVCLLACLTCNNQYQRTVAIISTNATIAIANDDDIVEHNNDTEADASL